MIYSFSGPSAIGKSTLCQLYADNHLIIPEVNLLFEKEKQKGKFWYYEKQVERFQMASTTGKNTILDGDVFQPIWYNWIYGYPNEFPSKSETWQFFLEKIKAKQISFPDLYIIFYTDESELRRRKESDATRRRRNFEKHLRLVQPHRRYFNFLKKETEIPVEFIAYNDIESTFEKVNKLMNDYSVRPINPELEFKKVVGWLKDNSPYL